MNDTTLINLVCMLAGFVIGVIVELVVEVKQISEQTRTIQKQKLEIQKLRENGSTTTQVIEINDNRAQPDSYFTPF